MNKHKIFLALPVMYEYDRLKAFLDCCRQQTIGFHLVVCVNQPEAWWDIDHKRDICLDNQKSLALLSSVSSFPIYIIDKSSKGKGWGKKKYGVGWARKLCMDHISSLAADDDIIISIDADTHFQANYIESVYNSLIAKVNAAALSIPYYHELSGDHLADKAILRYEIYMRYYFLNMWRIKNPYAFSALGSAMALRAGVYRKVGGITPHKSGEDFYFMQKLRKYGPLIHWCEESIKPEARFSERVFFGTGPAMIKGSSGDWSSYPIYDFKLFDDIKNTFEGFAEKKDKATKLPMDDFLNEQFAENDIYQPLRENFKTRDKFVRACTQKVDGLRILQYLKHKNKATVKDEEKLKQGLGRFFPSHAEKIKWDALDFQSDDLSIPQTIRNILYSVEMQLRKQDYEDFC